MRSLYIIKHNDTKALSISPCCKDTKVLAVGIFVSSVQRLSSPCLRVFVFDCPFVFIAPPAPEATAEEGKANPLSLERDGERLFLCFPISV